jgi:hypothetical protein
VVQATGAVATGIRVVHHVPGRVRVRVDGTRDEAEMLRLVGPLLARLPGVVSVRANAAAGSVVILYGPMGPDPGRGDDVRPHRLSRLAPGLLVPLAFGVGTRLLLPRRRPAPWWLDVALLAVDAIVGLRGARLVSDRTSLRRRRAARRRLP